MPNIDEIKVTEDLTAFADEQLLVRLRLGEGVV